MPAAHDVELDVGLVGGVLPLDHVTRPQAVDAGDLVTGLETRPLPGRTGCDSDDERRRHGSMEAI